MKKRFITLALAAMTLAPLGALAQNCGPQNCAKQNCAQQNCAQQNCATPCQISQWKQDYTTILPNQYQGLNLTDAQKSSLQKLDASRAEARRTAKAAKNADKAAAKAARTADRRQYLQEVQEIIGPDQYVVFLENFYVNGNQQSKANAPKQAKAHKAKKDHKSGKDRKPDRQLAVAE